MTDDASRLRRARLIARVRWVERQKAAADAFNAEAVRLKLQTLCERTRALARIYETHENARVGADLRAASLLAAHLGDLTRTATTQANDARHDADTKLAELTAAERRRKRAEEIRKTLHAVMLERAARVDTVPARKSGTNLE